MPCSASNARRPAAWFRPDYTIPAEPNQLLQGQQRDEANELQSPELHR